MTIADYLINAVFVLIVFRQARERELDRRSVIIPLAILAYVAHMYVRSIPIAGNDLVLVGAFGAIGLAPSACTTLTLGYEPGRTLLSVDNGVSATPPHEGMGGGRGLEGLRERVERAGGTMSAGPTAEGWRVQVEVPG